MVPILRESNKQQMPGIFEGFPRFFRALFGLVIFHDPCSLFGKKNYYLDLIPRAPGCWLVANKGFVRDSLLKM